MVLNITTTLRDRVRRMVHAKARAEGLGIALMTQIKADPNYGPLYAEHKAAYEESLMLEAKTLGMVDGNVDLLERLIRDVHSEGGATSRKH
ncbi:hypothetical protein EDE05_117106 [Neorhizobium sp. R1-B]|uniref:hypothetical protein n=1 Tax=Neorhizobium sp. R1-B TaxID=2485162 RepID=UPI0010647716|nr:hypothetical protein [Neorhizobium sp. R1-B]TDX76224.1 hypothetical protein EDE05_117106 [Neorhizobium sp. R1-B]